MDKPAEIYTPAELPAYTLYPDAGDVGELDTVTLPPVPRTPPVPSASVPSRPPAQPFTPSPLPPQSPPASVLPVPRRKPSPLRWIFRLACTACVLFAIFIYADLLLAGAKSLLAQGIGQLAIQSIYGAAYDVTVLPQTTETAPPETDTLPDETIPPETSPPATEQPAPVYDAGILPRDLSSSAADGLGLINETPYTPDLAALAARTTVIDTYAALESVYGQNCPAVLILHTHGTEAFSDCAEAGYHTENPAKNILAVGEALATTLTDAGIGVIHCTELFDAESFDMAYYNAARYIRQTLEANPSIRYILDVHRDAITTADGSGIRPLSLQDGTEYAQLMFVVGTDHGGSGHSDWENNLALAARLQSALHGENPTLMRDINLRSASFNAQYAPGALLVEAGAAASAREEAIRSIRVFGQALAREILGE